MKLHLIGFVGLFALNSFASEKNPTFCDIRNPQTNELIGDLKINWDKEVDWLLNTWTQKATTQFTGPFHSGEYEIIFERNRLSTRCAVQEMAFGFIPDFGKLYFGWNSYGYRDCENLAVRDYGTFISIDGKITQLKCN